jgi:hypothetical protein
MTKILRHLKDSLTYAQNSHSIVHSSYSLPDVSAGSIVRELCWKSKELYVAGIIITTHVHVSRGGLTIGPLVAAVLRSKSHPIDMISQALVQQNVLMCGTDVRQKL